MSTNKKISDLTSSGAIVGTEELPIVQSGSTVKATINTIKTFLKTYFDTIYKTTFTENTAFNKNFGTTAGTVLEGNAITQVITNGVTDKAPSEDAVFDALALKLTTTNNLSDLSNPLTARNNLKEWDVYMVNGNQSTTSNVASNITDLVSTTLEINKKYSFSLSAIVGCNNTGGVKFQITLPTGATFLGYVDGIGSSNTTRTGQIISASSTLTAVAFNTVSGQSFLRIDGTFTMSSTAGVIQFGFASATNTQTSTVYGLGTFLNLKQLD